ncbi:MAG: TolC family protein [Clostridiales bacterium]|jgi:hypothetical protein|nr:TolC family protein [Clostridiales bacterium]
MKKIFALVLAASVFFSGTKISFAADTRINLQLNGLFTGFRTQPVIKQGVTLMAMRELAGYVDADVTWDDYNQTAHLRKQGATLTMKIDTKRASFNEVQIELPVAPQYNNGRVMEDILVPMRYVAERFGGTVGWEESTKTITLDTGKDPLQIMEINQPKTANPIIIEYDQALKDAYSANSTLLNLSESFDVLNEQHSDTVDQLSELGYAYNLDSQPFTDTLRALKNIEVTMSSLPHNEQMVRETTEYMLRGTLSSIAQNEMDLQIMEENINLQSATVKSMKLKLELGMVSETNLKAAEQSLEQMQVNKEGLELIIKGERANLGKILNLPMNREIIVLYDPTIEAIRQVDFSSYIGEDPMIKLKRAEIDKAQYALDTVVSDLTDSKLQKQADLMTANRAYDDAVRDLSAAMTTTYNKLNQIAQNQKSLEIDVQKAKDNYKSMSINYQAGTVTLFELDTCKAAILNAEATLAKNEYTFWTMTFGLQHPYLLLE